MVQDMIGQHLGVLPSLFSKVLILVLRLGLPVINVEGPWHVVDLLTDLGSHSVTDENVHDSELSYLVQDASMHILSLFPHGHTVEVSE
jgi:hypothetical protein